MERGRFWDEKVIKSFAHFFITLETCDVTSIHGLQIVNPYKSSCVLCMLLLLTKSGLGWNSDDFELFEQVFSQPIFSAVELWASKKWPKSKFITKEYFINIGIVKKHKLRINLLRMIWRTLFVIMATLLAMVFPFFNDILALLGALGYWPLTVYFPIQMYIAKGKIRKWRWRWLVLQVINLVCLLVALAAACGSIQGLNKALNTYKPFEVKE